MRSLRIQGSSPRVRGSRYKIRYHCNPFGIIPAGAGLTVHKNHFPFIIRDHPRGCGAHEGEMPIAPAISGSSPRVRGSLCQSRHRSDSAGIIPAGAGLTTAGSTNVTKDRDHPRGCGAHFHSLPGVSYDQGSSPRVRGSPDDTVRTVSRDGIIPAGAGLTG